MRVYTVRAPENLGKMTLGAYIARAVPLLPAYALRDAFARRDVKMDGARCGREAIVRPGAEIAVYTPLALTLPVAYEDENVLILNKPAGVSADRDALGSLTVLDFARLYAADAFTPRMCHRIDNQTSGLIALAKNARAEQALGDMFAFRTGRKEYQCVVRGAMQPESAVREAYLQKDSVRARVKVLARETPGARLIQTEYHTLRKGEVSRLLVIPHTGRTHQIRAHLAYLGHPIVGDDVYGDRALNRARGADALMLCATRLVIQTNGALPALDGVEARIEPNF